MDAEIQEFIALLDRVKSGVRDFVREIGDEGVVWSPDVPDTNSVAVLVTHMFGSETEVTQEFVGGITVSRDRGSEFARPLTTVGELIDLIDRTNTQTRDVLSKETRATLARQVRTREPGEMKTVRSSLMGVLMHEAEHVGHMQLTEQVRQAQDV
jgi:hypothetical protein